MILLTTRESLLVSLDVAPPQDGLRPAKRPETHRWVSPRNRRLHSSLRRASHSGRSTAITSSSRCPPPKKALPRAMPSALNPTASRSEEHTSELQSHSFISYAVFCFKQQ